MKTLGAIVGLLVIGLGLNAQSVQFSSDHSMAQMPDTQDDYGLVLVEAFDVNNTSAIHTMDGDMIDLKLFPNPAIDIVTVDLKNIEQIENIEFSIINVSGQQMGNWKLVESFSNGSSCKLDVSNLPTGTYIIQIKNSNNLNLTKHIQKF